MTAPALSRQFVDIPAPNVVDALNTFIREMNQWFQYIREQITVPATGLQEFVEVSPANLADALNALVTETDERFAEIYAAMGADYEHMTAFTSVAMQDVTPSVNQIIVEANQRYGFMYGALPYLAVVAAGMPTTMTAARKGGMLGMFSLMQTVGALDSTDVFWDVFGAEDAANEVINLIAPGVKSLTKVGTTVQAQGYGAKGDASTGYYDTNFVLGSDGVRFQTSAGGIVTSEASNVANSNIPIASVIGTTTGRTGLVPRTGGSQYGAALNVSTTAGTAGGSATTSIGHFGVQRNGNTVVAYKNGALAGWSYSLAATAVLGRSLYWLARNNNGTADQFSARYARFLMIGNYSAAQMAAIAEGFDAYISVMLAPLMYASAVSYGGIPIGSDSTGLGSSAAPFLTIDTVNSSSAATQTIMLNGDPNSPQPYKHASRLSLQAGGLDSVEPHGATLQATTGAEVLLISAAATIGHITIDGQSVNTQGIELSNTPTEPFDVAINSTDIAACTLFAIWTSATKCYARLTLTDATGDLSVGRGFFEHYLGAGASFVLDGGTFVHTGVTSGAAAGLANLLGQEAGATVSVNPTHADITMDATMSGASLTIVNIRDVEGAYVSGDYTVDGNNAAKAINLITITASQRSPALESGSFIVENVTAELSAAALGSSKGITIGYDGTTDFDASNGKLNGGVVRNCAITGADAATQTSGFHAILIASWADTLVENCVLTKCYLGFGIKESRPTIRGGSVTDFTAYGVVLKGSKTGTVVTGVTTKSIAGNNGTRHFDAHVNTTTGNNCQETWVTENNFVNDGATGVIFVDVDVGQDIHFSGNNYYNKSGTLDAFPWRYHGVNYATFAAWKAAVEPDATSFDLGV